MPSTASTITPLNTNHPSPMKTYSIPAFALALLLTAGCTKEEQQQLAVEAELLLQYNSIEFTVEPGPYDGQVELTLNFNGEELNTLLSDNGYTMDQLQEFTFTKAELHILMPDSQTFDPVDMAEMRLSASGGDPRIIASLNPVPDGVRDVSLAVTNANAADILRSTDVALKMVAEVHGTITEPVLMRADLGGRVVVRL